MRGGMPFASIDASMEGDDDAPEYAVDVDDTMSQVTNPWAHPDATTSLSNDDYFEPDVIVEALSNPPADLNGDDTINADLL